MIFDEMCEKPLRSAHEMNVDEVRKELDERFLGKSWVLTHLY